MFVKVARVSISKVISSLRNYSGYLLFLGLVCGISFSSILELDLLHPFLFLFIIFFVLILAIFSQQRRLFTTFLYFFSFLMFGIFLSYEKSSYGKQLLEQANSIDLSREYEIIADVDSVTYKNGDTILILSGIEGLSSAYDGRVRVKVSGKRTVLEDDMLSMSTWLEKPENFEGFDYVRYLSRKDVFLLGEVETFEIVGKRDSLVHWVAKLRSEVINRVRHYLSEPASSLLLGLTVGYRADFDDSFEDALQKTGTTHIIAVSGYNVALLVAILVGLSTPLGRHLGTLLSFFGLIFFCFITNFNIPVLRAALMFFILWFAKSNGRKCPPLLGLSLASMILLIVNPYVLWDLSFQLSFLSTLGLIGGGLIKVIEKTPSSLEFLQDSLVSTFWAFVFTLPVIAYNFGSITLLTFLSNLLVLPFVNIVTILGLVFVFATILGGIFAQLASLLVFPFLYFIYSIIEQVAKIPFGLVSIDFDIRRVTVYYLMLSIIMLFGTTYFELRKDGKDKG